jgi:hypothetical protein
MLSTPKEPYSSKRVGSVKRLMEFVSLLYCISSLVKLVLQAFAKWWVFGKGMLKVTVFGALALRAFCLCQRWCFDKDSALLQHL